MTFAIYLVGLVDNLQCILMVAVVFLTIGVGIMAFTWCVFKKDRPNEHEIVVIETIAKLLRPMVLIILIAATVATLTPSSRTLAAMIVLPRLAESKQVQNIADNSLRALEKLTVEWAKETVLDGGELSDE